jgi:hypothetical protein
MSAYAAWYLFKNVKRLAASPKSPQETAEGV